MITLYVDGYFVSPLDGTCMIALAEKGVEYTTARALLRDGQGVPAALGTKALIARVPTLQHGDFYLSESLAILDYIETAFPPPAYPRLFPADPRARARTWQVMAYIRFGLHQIREERQWWTCVYPGPEPAPLSARALHEADEWVAIANRMMGALGDWSIAHADLALQLIRLSRNGYPMPDAVAAFIETTCARPSVRAYIEHPRPPFPPPRPSALG